MRSRPIRLLGQVLIDARMKKGLSQKEVAEMLKKRDGTPLQAGYLSDLENDRRSPPEFLVPQLAAILDLKPDVIYLLSGTLPPDLVLSADDAARVELLFQDFTRTKRFSE